MSEMVSEQVYFLSNKNSKFTPQFEKITNKYNLKLDASWNIALMPHMGRHTDGYHKYMLNELTRIDKIANGDLSMFMKLFEGIKKVVIGNPDILYKK